MKDEEQPKRSRLIGEILKPHMLPGDVALIVGADDSRSIIWGEEYRKAYAEGTLTAKHTYWSVFLAFRLLLENMEFHKKYCLPKELHRTHIMNVEPQVEKFQKAMASGTLMPEDTFRIICGMVQEMLGALEGHMAACMPNEFRQMIGRLQELKAAPQGGGENAS